MIRYIFIIMLVVVVSGLCILINVLPTSDQSKLAYIGPGTEPIFMTFAG